MPDDPADLINKRLTLNLLIQGAATHAFLSAHYVVEAELNALNPKLIPLYDQVSVGGFLSCWYGDLVLILGTPNADSDRRQAHGTRWLGFNPFHIVLFSRQNLTRLLHETGFEVVEAYTYANDDPGRSEARSGWRDAARSVLRASGALQWARKARDTLQGRTDQSFDPRMLETAMNEVADGGFDGYRFSADGRHHRASSCRGDNLVLIARRI